MPANASTPNNPYTLDSFEKTRAKPLDSGIRRNDGQNPKLSNRFHFGRD